jgi:ABC-type transport system involved in cytochrome c biogenesis ATPase subunit
MSVGQWQRVALARGFFGDAPFIILDEPTAALGGRYADLFAVQASAYLAPCRPSPTSGSRRYSTKSWPW